MPASPMLRIDFADGTSIEARMNTWMLIESQFAEGNWQFRSLLNIRRGSRIKPGYPDDDTIREVMAVTQLPYKNQRK